jgi:hypothetical protein
MWKFGGNNVGEMGQMLQGRNAAQNKYWNIIPLLTSIHGYSFILHIFIHPFTYQNLHLRIHSFKNYFLYYPQILLRDMTSNVFDFFVQVCWSLNLEPWLYHLSYASIPFSFLFLRLFLR